MNTESKFGEPVELPWWAAALAIPPAIFVLMGLLIGASVGVRLLAIVPAIALIMAVVRIATQVRSTSMQSVWVSLVYALWALFPVAYMVALAAH